MIARKSRTLTPKEFDRLIRAVPDRYRPMVETFIETGTRWCELIALRPRHIDFLRHSVTVEETIVEPSKTHSPTGEQFIVKPYPKDNEPRNLRHPPRLAGRHSGAHQESRDRSRRPPLHHQGRDPISRNSFRTHVWLPAVKASGVGFNVRIHDLRHAPASWLLAGGSDLKIVMDRMGDSQIQTTQRYLHALPDADQKNLDALNRIAGRSSHVEGDR